MKVDVHRLVVVKEGARRETVVAIADYKTGKERPDHALQRSLYALGALIMYPDAARATAAHWYLDAGKEGGPEVWERSQLPDLKREWTNRSRAMLGDRTFSPTPGRHCQWCAFSKEKGGPCRY